MNRIIIIGNGFDLFHGFETSYKHFITHYWQKKFKIITQVARGTGYKDNDIQISKCPSGWINNGEQYVDIMRSIQSEGGSLSFINTFLQKITTAVQVNNWVDIENEYYRELKNLTVQNDQIHLVEKLNKEFLSIQNELELYLTEIEENQIMPSLRNNLMADKLFSHFYMRDFTQEHYNAFVEQEYNRFESSKKTIDGNLIPAHIDEKTISLIRHLKGCSNPKEEIRSLLLSDYANSFFTLIPNEILILNFNYTQTEVKYLGHEYNEYGKKISRRTEVIHIHGELGVQNNNPIVFGFGDELDEDYKKIENLNKNECLNFIKSIKYLEKSNYKKLLEFINTDQYQITVFGHSCGLSDRTLLNTLFENSNCVSIKPYYHQTDSGDNYADIIKNISRCFNNKATMRDKLVNKEYCMPM